MKQVGMMPAMSASAVWKRGMMTCPQCHQGSLSHAVSLSCRNEGGDPTGDGLHARNACKNSHVGNQMATSACSMFAILSYFRTRTMYSGRSFVMLTER